MRSIQTMKPLAIKVFFLLTLLLTPQAFAVDTAVEKQIRETLASVVPEEQVTRIRPTPFKDLYEVLLGPNVVYISGDGRYILKGDLLDMQSRENISERERKLARKNVLESLSDRDFIEFSPAGADHLLYVFTDIECGYCRKLHQDVPELNSKGIGVRYLAYPRGGMGTDASRTMESVWCAKDRQQALTDAKSDKVVEPKRCNNPVADEYELGRRFGIRGTPAIYTDDGEGLRGYLPPHEIEEILNEQP